MPYDKLRATHDVYHSLPVLDTEKIKSNVSSWTPIFFIFLVTGIYSPFPNFCLLSFLVSLRIFINLSLRWDINLPELFLRSTVKMMVNDFYITEVRSKAYIFTSEKSY